MQKAQIYIAKTPAGNYKAYALGYSDDYKGDPNDTNYHYKPLPDQPLRGFSNPAEVSTYIHNKFNKEYMFDEWSAKQAGNGSLLNKSMDGWQIFSWGAPIQNLQNPNNVNQKVDTMPRRKKNEPVELEQENDEYEDESSENDDDNNDDDIGQEEEDEPVKLAPIKRRKRRAKKQRASNVGNNAFDPRLSAQPQSPFSSNVLPNNSMSPAVPSNIFFTNSSPQNNLSQDQYRQLAEGVLHVFENTLMTAATYNMMINSVTLAYAYKAVKLMGSFQFYPAFESAKMAATHDNVWINLRDSIIQANRYIGVNI